MAQYLGKVQSSSFKRGNTYLNVKGERGTKDIIILGEHPNLDGTTLYITEDNTVVRRIQQSDHIVGRLIDREDTIPYRFK